jgi:hypothetical protein
VDPLTAPRKRSVEGHARTTHLDVHRDQNRVVAGNVAEQEQRAAVVAADLDDRSSAVCELEQLIKLLA